MGVAYLLKANQLRAEYHRIVKIGWASLTRPRTHLDPTLVVPFKRINLHNAGVLERVAARQKSGS